MRQHKDLCAVQCCDRIVYSLVQAGFLAEQLAAAWRSPDYVQVESRRGKQDEMLVTQ